MHDITLPKYVTIENRRLKTVYVVAVVVVLAFCGARLYLTPWFFWYPISDALYADLHPGTPLDLNVSFGSLGCTRRDTVEICSVDAEAKGECGCIRVCSEGVLSVDCLDQKLFTMSTHGGNIFVPTHLWQKLGSTGEAVNYIVPFTKRAVIGIDVAYGNGPVNKLPAHFPKSLYEFDGNGIFHILDNKMKLVKIVRKTAGKMLFSIEEMLSYAGRPSLLHIPELTGLQPGATLKSNAWHTGAELQVWVDCGNTWNSNIKDFDVQVADDGFACFMSFRVRERTVSVMSRSPAFDMDQHFHGILVSVKASGSLEFLNGSEIVAWLVEVLVFIGLPTQLVLFLATLCLGNLSRIYRNAIVDRFSIAIAMRKLMACAIMALHNFNRMAVGKSGIPKITVSDSLRAITLDFEKEKQEKLAGFCHYVAVSADASDTAPFALATKRTAITMRQYMEAHTSVAQLRPDLLAGLFEKRKVGRLERLFAPRFISRTLDVQYNDRVMAGQHVDRSESVMLDEDLEYEEGAPEIPKRSNPLKAKAEPPGLRLPEEKSAGPMIVEQMSKFRKETDKQFQIQHEYMLIELRETVAAEVALLQKAQAEQAKRLSELWEKCHRAPKYSDETLAAITRLEGSMLAKRTVLDSVATDRVGTDRVGTDRVGIDSVGADGVGTNSVFTDRENTLHRMDLKIVALEARARDLHDEVASLRTLLDSTTAAVNLGEKPAKNEMSSLLGFFNPMLPISMLYPKTPASEPVAPVASSEGESPQDTKAPGLNIGGTIAPSSGVAGTSTQGVSDVSADCSLGRTSGQVEPGGEAERPAEEVHKSADVPAGEKTNSVDGEGGPAEQNSAVVDANSVPAVKAETVDEQDRSVRESE